MASRAKFCTMSATLTFTYVTFTYFNQIVKILGIIIIVFFGFN